MQRVGRQVDRATIVSQRQPAARGERADSRDRDRRGEVGGGGEQQLIVVAGGRRREPRPSVVTDIGAVAPG